MLPLVSTSTSPHTLLAGGRVPTLTPVQSLGTGPNLTWRTQLPTPSGVSVTPTYVRPHPRGSRPAVVRARCRRSEWTGPAVWTSRACVIGTRTGNGSCAYTCAGLRTDGPSRPVRAFVNKAPLAKRSRNDRRGAVGRGRWTSLRPHMHVGAPRHPRRGEGAAGCRRNRTSPSRNPSASTCPTLPVTLVTVAWGWAGAR